MPFCFFFLAFTLLNPAWSQDTSLPPPIDSAEPPSPDTAAPQAQSAEGQATSSGDGIDENGEVVGPLPSIEAKTFPIKVIKRSNSNRVYLFEDTNGRQPADGRILLLKREDEPIMAFRVLRTYPEDNQIAAKQLKKYGQHLLLEPDSTFLAIEKISDIESLPTAQDKADLKELESNRKILAYDPELDAAASPPPRNGLKEDVDINIDPNKLNSEHLLEESQIIDRYIHWVSAGFGFFLNNNAANASQYFSAAGLRYGISIGRLLMLDQAKLQDSLVLESGFYLYKALNYLTQGDAFTIFSLLGTLRYNIMFSDSFGIFFYGGLLSNNVLSSAQATGNSLQQLNSTYPAIGTGVLLQVGPSWFARLDIGYESVGLGLILRF